MVPIGSNTLCIETTAYVGSPAYFTSLDMSTPYVLQPDADDYWSSYVVRDTATGLDSKARLSNDAVAGICVLVMLVVGSVITAVVFLVKRRSLRSRTNDQKFWA